MKKIYILHSILALLLLGMISACDQENKRELYTPAATLAFAIDQSASTKIISSAPTLEIDILRTDGGAALTGEDLTVRAFYDDGDGKYSDEADSKDVLLEGVTAKYHFEAGKCLGKVHINAGVLPVGDMILIDLIIPDAKATATGDKQTQIEVMMDYTWEPYGKVTLKSAFFEAAIPDVVIEKAVKAEAYRLVDYWKAAGATEPATLEFKINKDNSISFISKTQPSGLKHQSYGMISLEDVGASKYDPATRVVSIAAKYVVSAGSFGTAESTFVLPEAK